MDIPCVGAIIRDDEGRIVLVQRADPPSERMWSIPGGRVEEGESPLDAVKREVLEETGLQVHVNEPAGSVVLPGPTSGVRYLVTDYFATVVPGTSMAPVPGDDAAEARWVNGEEFLMLDLTPDLAATLQQWRVWGEVAPSEPEIAGEPGS